ncbi:MAG: TetR/AcrR family transcriptional regulator [Pseudomonadota bacterium]|nr:TetR/AcrR family transcriptional regulator [Pseudomonadota bacterium]
MTPPDTSIRPRKAPAQARSQERFERILEVSAELMATSGSGGLKVADIAAAAGISLASLYQYFPDKTAIVATLADRINASCQVYVQDAFRPVATIDDLLVAIHAMIDGYFGMFLSNPLSVAVWRATQSDPRLQELDREDCEKHAMTLANGLRAALPAMPDIEAIRTGRVLGEAISGTVRMAFGLPPEEGLATVETCKTTVLDPAIRACAARWSGDPTC